MYIETLPPSCPPSHAVDEQRFGLWRAVSQVPAQEIDFKSHRWLVENGHCNKRKPKDVSDCTWSSCSFFSCEESIRRKMGLPGLKGKIPVEVDLPQGSGLACEGRAGHVDYWFFASCNPVRHVRP